MSPSASSSLLSSPRSSCESGPEPEQEQVSSNGNQINPTPSSPLSSINSKAPTPGVTLITTTTDTSASPLQHSESLIAQSDRSESESSQIYLDSPGSTLNTVLLFAGSPTSVLPLSHPVSNSSSSPQPTSVTNTQEASDPDASLHVLADVSLQQRPNPDVRSLKHLLNPSPDSLELLSSNLGDCKPSVEEHGPQRKKSRSSTLPLTPSPPTSLTPRRPIQTTTTKRASSTKARKIPTPKYRSDELVTLPLYEELLDTTGNLPLDLSIEPQQKSCASLPHHLRGYRCAPCISKLTGFVCAFRYIRTWIHRRGEPSSAPPFGGPILPLSNDTPIQLTYRYPQFPTHFNRLPRSNEFSQLRRIVSRALRPVLEQERAWYSEDPSVRFIGRRIELLTNCDYCSATLIGAAWMCQKCGNEACVRCFEILRELRVSEQPASASLTANKHPDWLKQIGACTKWCDGKHSPNTHLKISHLTREEIESMLAEIEMEEIHAPQDLTNPAVITQCSDLGQYLHQPEDSDSEPYYKIPVMDLEADSSLFDRLWSMGEVIVVTGMKERFRLPWTPEHLRNKYSDESCQMLDSNLPHHNARPTTVGKFFKMFEAGADARPGGVVWKLRDWPPETDFKRKFPELFNDFQRAIPIADTTNRRGVRNLAAHFPLNANVPDIGPKMYIAMQNSDQSGSQGSTVLHMDVADAINVQTYARTNDGEEGCALWHLYHARHATKLRDFLYQHHANKLGVSIEEAKQKYDDPIHTTRTYIDSQMRKQLSEEFGIKGWEIKQRPGEAVLIPAYTAHQVCNLANCIKVAADFVSPQSIQRCLTLKEEFRVQNAESRKPWRQDVLQINQMLLYAFKSLGRPIEGLRVDESIEETLEF